MMSYNLHKRATGADRARRRVHTPGEALVPSFTADGMVLVTTSKASTVRVLQARGWKLASEPAAAPAPAPAPEAPVETAEPMDRASELRAMTVRELRAMARDLGVRGRSSMREDDLVEAIMAAEAV